jgi:hypothetical protein
MMKYDQKPGHKESPDEAKGRWDLQDRKRGKEGMLGDFLVWGTQGR